MRRRYEQYNNLRTNYVEKSGAMIDEGQRVRKITVTGRGTYSMTLPKAMVRNLKWRKGQRVVVERKGNTLVIRDFE